MYGKYGKIIGERGIRSNNDAENDAPIYGFATPKKNSMQDRTNLILSASKKTPVSKAMERVTPRKSSAPNSPTSRKLGTPLSRLKLRGDAPATPRSVRKRVTVDIEKALDSSTDEEDSEAEDSEVDSDDDDGCNPIEKSAIRSRSNVDTDDFFEKQGVKDIITSDKTLSQLKTPRLSPEVLRTILEDEPLKHSTKIEDLMNKSKKAFHKWFHLLRQDFNIVLYGLGSKKSLLNEFHAEKLGSQDCVVINGFFPSLTMKHIMGVIMTDILELQGQLGASHHEQAETIMRTYSGDTIENDLYLIVHNIDGPMLRNEASQSVLAKLASHPRIHFLCSIDHINAPLLWDQHKLSTFNFIWQDATTFLPYSEETLNENSLMVRSGGSGLALHSLLRVFESLTPNAKEIYQLIIDEQMKVVEEVGLTFYSGLSFRDLYRYVLSDFQM